MSRIRRVFTRSRRRPIRAPWMYERLATLEEITELTKADVRKIA